ncbi:alpha/beta hydrolase [Salinispora fenicalii]|uniref:alpha/beta hydrolase n=1 Tax=Salinispora fenicalii TaxID=1137263 RepID=UPI000484DADC|nr:acetylhydrolase [Salinispora fenicalii]
MWTFVERATLTATALTTTLILFAAPTSVALPAIVAVTALSILRLVNNSARWQMAPGYLAVVWLCVAVVTELPVGVRIVGGLVALLLSTASAALVVGFPIPSLPQPDGPFGVGMITTTEERDVGTAPRMGRRRLFVTTWYPAEANLTQRRGEALWSEFHEAPGIPSGLRRLAGYLKQVRTHAIRDAHASRHATTAPIVLYQPGLVSITSENSLLMESLASHGYIVVSVRHIDQRAELEESNAAVAPATARRTQEINRELRGKLTRSERARISAELYQLSTSTATVVARRTEDSQHVLDRLPTILASVPGYPTGEVGSGRPIATMGLSLGGAVASELSKIDNRCTAAINIDGGLYSERPHDPLSVPYLMIYSELNSGSNDFARDIAQAEFHEMTVPGAKHLDFHDATVVLPILRWLGHLGDASGIEIARWKNSQIQQFLDRTVRCTTPDTSAG